MLVEIVEDGLSSQKITEGLLKKLHNLNPSVKELFTQKDYDGKERLALSGLFNASLMKGH